MRLKTKSAWLCGVLVVVIGTLRAADWEAPKDGKFTEKQLENFLGAQKELMQYYKAAGKAIEGSTGLGAVAVLGNIDNKIKSIIEKHSLQKAEYEWLSRAATECWGATILDEAITKGKEGLVEQKKKNAADIAAAKVKVAAYESAKKNGTRVLTAEQREALVKQAKEQETSALDEAKARADEAKGAGDEAAKYEADAKAADALAAKPPADVEADGRVDYINGKKEEAKSARASAKEARDKETEQRKAEAENKVKAAGFAKQAQHPEIPVTPDEKQQTTDENTQGLSSAKEELETLTQATTLLAEGDEQIKKQTEEIMKNIVPENFALVKKHLKEFKSSMGIPEGK